MWLERLWKEYCDAINLNKIFFLLCYSINSYSGEIVVVAGEILSGRSEYIHKDVTERKENVRVLKWNLECEGVG